jgi:hypothetical protein
LNYIVELLNLKSFEEDSAKLNRQMLLVGDLIRTKFLNLTIPEVKEAFKMYVSKELGLKVFRLVDCVAVGEILTAYTEFKQEKVQEYQNKKDNALNSPKTIPKKEDIKKIRHELLELLFDDLNKNGSADYAWTLYDDLKQKKLIEISIKDGEELYERELILYTKEIKDKSKDRVHFKMQMDDLQRIINSNHRVKIVQNKCRSILVCRVLRRYLDDFEEFKKIGDVLD